MWLTNRDSWRLLKGWGWGEAVLPEGCFALWMWLVRQGWLFFKGLPVTKFGLCELNRSISYESRLFAVLPVIRCYGNVTAQSKGSESPKLPSNWSTVWAANKFAYFVNLQRLPALFKVETEEQNTAWGPAWSFHPSKNVCPVLCLEHGNEYLKNSRSLPGYLIGGSKSCSLVNRSSPTHVKGMSVRALHSVCFGSIPLTKSPARSR